MTAPTTQHLIPSAFYLGYLAAFFTQSAFYATFVYYLLWSAVFAAAFYADAVLFQDVVVLIPLSATLGALAGLLVSKMLDVRPFIRLALPKNSAGQPVSWMLIATLGLMLFVYALVAIAFAPPTYVLYLGDHLWLGLLLLAGGSFMVFAGSITMIWSFAPDGQDADRLTVYYSGVLIVCAAVPALIYERVHLINGSARLAEGLLAAIVAAVLLGLLLGIVALAERSMATANPEKFESRLGVKWFPISYRISLLALSAFGFYVIGGVLSTPARSNAKLVVLLGLYSLLLIVLAGLVLAGMQLYSANSDKKKRT